MMSFVPLTEDRGVMKKLLVAGTGDVPGANYKICCHYVATLENGTMFDSSRERGSPYEFDLDGGRVIKVNARVWIVAVSRAFSVRTTFDSLCASFFAWCIVTDLRCVCLCVCARARFVWAIVALADVF